MMKMISDILNRKDGKKAKGFTLIELLVVVVIIGILAAIAVPIYLNQRKAAWNSTVQSDVKNASLVVETATTSNNGALPTEVTSGKTITAGDGKDHTIGGSTVTVSTGNTLVFAKGADNNSYTIKGSNSNGGTKTYTYDSSTGSIN